MPGEHVHAAAVNGRVAGRVDQAGAVEGTVVRRCGLSFSLSTQPSRTLVAEHWLSAGEYCEAGKRIERERLDTPAAATEVLAVLAAVEDR